MNKNIASWILSTIHTERKANRLMRLSAAEAKLAKIAKRVCNKAQRVAGPKEIALQLSEMRGAQPRSVTETTMDLTDTLIATLVAEGAL